jgi:hypothetical protein
MKKKLSAAKLDLEETTWTFFLIWVLKRDVISFLETKLTELKEQNSIFKNKKK